MDDTTANTTVQNGWVKLYHPSGAQITLPVPVASIVTPEMAIWANQTISNYLAAGFAVDLAGLEQGEVMETISHLVRRVKANDDDTETPVLDIYTGGNFRVVSVYLNTPEDVSAFVQASGLALNKLPKYDGDTPIERGKNVGRDKQYVIPVTGVSVVYKANPKYEGDQDKKHAKRVFVRWQSKITHMQETVIRTYEDGEPVGEKSAEITAYDAYKAAFGKPADSKEILRAWVSSQKN